MKLKRGFLSIIPMVLALFALIPLTSATCGELIYNDTFKYEINEGGKDISIIECISDESKITVPDEIDGLPVTIIKEKAFNKLSSMSTVTLSKSLTEIKECAFYYCENLRRISIPDGVTTIGSGAFFNCTALSSATIPDSLISNNQVFSLCDDLQMVTYKGSFKQLAKIPNAFYGMVVQCSDYTVSGMTRCGAQNGDVYDSVAYFIQNGDTVIIAGEGAITDSQIFYRDKANIKNVVILDGVTRIGEKAFYEFENLESITIPGSVTSVGKNAFYGTAYVNNDENRENGVLYINNILYDASKNTDETYSIKAGTSFICDSSFYNNDTLKEVVIPDSVTGIGNGAFNGCTNLTSITIPDSITSIGDLAFYGCKGLTSITIPDCVTSIGYSAFDSCTGLTSVTIPDSVTSIGSSAFSGCTGLTSITIPDSVTSIDSFVFHGCTELTSVTIPDSVTSIGYAAFDGCTGLTSITIPDSVTSIYDSAFYNCSGLKSVTIGSGVKSIGNSAFSGGWNYRNDKIDSVYISDLDAWCGIEFADNGANPLRYADNLYLNNELVTDLVIPGGVTNIGNYAFCGYDKITSVTIPDSVTSIGSSAFNGCTGLTNVIIGNGAESIGEETFSDCTSLTAFNVGENNANYSSQNGVLFNKDKTTLLLYPKGKEGAYEVPDSVTRIEEKAFYACKSLTNITISDSVTSIGYDAFSGSGLDNAENVIDSVLYIDNCLIYRKAYRITEHNIKEGTRLIADSAFSESHIKSITIPDSVKNIGESAFSGCYSLTSVTIGNGVENIGKNVFSGDRNMTSVTIGKGVKTVGEDAFGCRNLKDVYISDIGAWCEIDFANETANPLWYAENLYLNNELVTDLVIPDGVTKIGSYAFSDCDGLTSVTIGNGVENIGKRAFYGCNNITNVTIPDSVTSIDEEAFSSCYNLTSVTIGNGLKTVGKDAFGSCSKLTGVYISDIGAWYATDFVNVSASPLCYTKNLYLNNELVTEVVIPEGTTKIGSYAFCYDDNLTSITIPEGVTSIGEGSFYYCDNLKSITIPKSVTSIGDDAFYGCYLSNVYISDIGAWCGIDFAGRNKNPAAIYTAQLYLNNEQITDLVIPDGVTKIGSYAFYNMNQIDRVTIPKSVTSIGDYAFECGFIYNTYYKGSETQWKKIEIGENNDDLTRYITYAEESEPDPTPVPTPAPTPMPEITAEIARTDADTDTAYTFTVTPENPNENCSVYAAVYDGNGTLLAVSREALQTSGDTVVSVNKSDADNIIKVFIWADKTIQPVLAKAEIFDLN